MKYRQIEANQCESFSHLSECCPQLDLDNNDFAIVLSIAPCSQQKSEGHAVVAHFSSFSNAGTHAQLLLQTLEEISGWGNKIEINLISASVKNPNLQTLRNLLKLPQFKNKIEKLSWRNLSTTNLENSLSNLPISTLKSSTINFNPNGSLSIKDSQLVNTNKAKFFLSIAGIKSLFFCPRENTNSNSKAISTSEKLRPTTSH